MVILSVAVVAIALFARQYGVTCEKCHTVVPHLNAFGAHFLASGERLPVDGISTSVPLPFAAKVNLVASTVNQGPGPEGAGLPKAVVDEIELFTAGTIGNRASYFVEQYVVDGAELGSLREAWIDERVNPWRAKIPLYVQAGSFTLPLPVDPETFRESYQDYAPFVQTVGDNPFDFKAARYGVQATAGDVLRGASLRAFAGPRDVMIAASNAAGALTASVYRYAGSHPLGMDTVDRFSRTGYALTYERGKWTSESLLQTGWDSAPFGIPSIGASSSAGFTQLRYAFDRRLFALARYEGTNDPNGFARDGVVLLGYGPTEYARLTLEDVISGQAFARNVLNLQLTVGF